MQENVHFGRFRFSIPQHLASPLPLPGPVHIELAEDVAAEVTPTHIFDKLEFRRPIADVKGIDHAVDMLMNAKHPIVIIGAAANRQRAVRALRAFVEETGICWCSTQMGKGVVDERSHLFLGTTAISSKDYCHYAMDFSDVLVICGHDESEKPPVIMTPGGKRKVIHISFSAAHVDNVYSPTLQVVGDVANAVWQIHEKLRAKGKTWDQPVLKRYKELTDQLLREGMDDGAFPMNITRVVADIRKVLPEDGILSLDNGLYKVVFARLFQTFLPNTIMLDNALATMGAGIPNAIATNLLFPDRKVVSISGDGKFYFGLTFLPARSQDHLMLEFSSPPPGTLLNRWRANEPPRTCHVHAIQTQHCSHHSQ